MTDCRLSWKVTGYTMAKCTNCGIEILDFTEHCPLCGSVLAFDNSLESMYPDIRVKIRRMLLAAHIYLFASIIATALLVLIELYVDPPLRWSPVVGLSLLYVYMILRYAIIGRSGYRSKVFVLTLLGLSLAFAADIITGYRGWSVDYVLPLAVVFIDIGIAVCMIVNHRQWHSYIMWQLVMILCSCIPAGLFLLGLENNVCMAFLPMGLSLSLFLGTLIIGDRRAVQELKRRFHIN